MTDEFHKYFGTSGASSKKEPSSPEDPFAKMAGDMENSMREHKKKTDALYEPYLQVMHDYSHHATPGKWAFFNGNPNEGYKCHLNVKPEHIRQVSNFLVSNDFEHKYLRGGEVEDGKIFTVYMGSRKQAEQIVREITDGVGSLLDDPKAHEEPYAPRIVGRFVGSHSIFMTKSAIHGVTLLNNTEHLDQEQAFHLADLALKDMYGDYYGGGITSYQP